MIRSIPDRIAEVRQHIAVAARQSGRSAESVTLVVVTKTVEVERIQAAVGAGIVHLGENRIQEAKEKIGRIQGAVHWHLVGHLQTNKARDAVSWFHLIHSIDRMEVAEKISKEGDKQGKIVEGLIQVNVGEEVTKGGWKVEEVPEAVTAVAKLSHLRIRGLMTIAPHAMNPEDIRPVFRRLKQLFEVHRFSGNGQPWDCLSMGMSNDYAVAIEEGSTMVRIGTAIFGDRLSGK